MKYDMSKDEFKALKNEIKTASDFSQLKCIVKAHRQQLSSIPTAVLNSWLRHGTELVFERVFGMVVIRKRYKRLKTTDYKSILPKVIALLNYLDTKYKLFNDEQKTYLNNNSTTEYQRLSTVLDAI
jgi:hypothetical protein